MENTPSLNQGKKFKKYQNKIDKRLERKAMKLSGIEGFTDMDSNSTPGLTAETEEVIESNSFINNARQQELVDNLRNNYQTTLQEYESLNQTISNNVTNYINRTNSDNPYLNKTIKFSNGKLFYVTNQGVAKYIPSSDILNSVNIPKTYTNISVAWDNKYLTPGVTIPTNPSLVTGTPVKQGQSFGNEGLNVFVNNFLPSGANASYMGCYSASPNDDNMTFIGGAPATSTSVSILNGSFSEPVIANNTYQYITSASDVPNWYFGGAVLLNNSSAWGYPIPYPNGNQCVSIQMETYIYQMVNLSAGVNYTLTFNACGRNCCSGSNVNPVNVQLYTSANAFISTIQTITPPINSWTPYTVTFTAPTTQAYNLYFSGTTTSDQSTAIQNISLSGAVAESGTYTYQQCQDAAVQQGYQFFALQNVNTSTATGYCAVTNSEPAISQYGEATTVAKSIVLWSSKTSNQTGNTALLNSTGSLQVLNSSGQAVYSTPSNKANPTNYLGCYGDSSSSPAMTAYNNAAQQYDMSQCQAIAQQNSYSYFGLQNSTSGQNAICMLSNDLDQTLQYGVAKNCTRISDGSWSGGGLSNAVYNTTSLSSNYFLLLQDNGNMVIYRGTGPNDNQGLIWQTNTSGKQQQANPAMAAANGKYGQNWIVSGSTLAPGDFVGSPKGVIALVMQTNGNLALYTYQMKSNCSKMSDGNMGGGVGANAAYNIGQTSIPGNIGKLAYVDGDSNLYSYPNSNSKYSDTYSIYKNLNSTGNDIQGASFSNATVQSCETACNDNGDCAGFVFDNNSMTCYPKTSGIYPYSTDGVSPAQNVNVYLRNVIPSTPPTGITQTTNNLDTLTYNNYINNGEISGNYGLTNATSTQKQQLEQLEAKMGILSNQITKLTTQYQNGTDTAEQQSEKNVSGLNGYLNDLNATNSQIISTSGDNNGSVQNILKDSDIVVLQKNYDYLFWSILAAGTVLVTMNIVKK